VVNVVEAAGSDETRDNVLEGEAVFNEEAVGGIGLEVASDLSLWCLGSATEWQNRRENNNIENGSEDYALFHFYYFFKYIS